MKKIIITTIALICGITTQAQTGIVHANGINIFNESFGRVNDPAVIMIMGTGAPMTDWPVELCEEIAKKGYRVIRFDNRDIGLSTKLDSLGPPDWAAIIPFVRTCDPAPLPYTLLDMARDVVGLMDALGIPKAHIAGASMGGAIAQLVAIHFPDRVLSLISISASSGNPELPPGDEEALKAMSTPPPPSKNSDTLAAYLIHVYKALGSTDDEATLRKRAMTHINRSWYPEGTTRQVAAVLIGDNCDRRNQLAELRMPALIIHGDVDPIVKPQAGIEVASVIPGAKLVMVPGMGHDPSEKFIDALVTALANHLR